MVNHSFYFSAQDLTYTFVDSVIFTVYSVNSGTHCNRTRKFTDFTADCMA